MKGSMKGEYDNFLFLIYFKRSSLMYRVIILSAPNSIFLLYFLPRTKLQKLYLCTFSEESESEKIKTIECEIKRKRRKTEK